MKTGTRTYAGSSTALVPGAMGAPTRKLISNGAGFPSPDRPSIGAAACDPLRARRHFFCGLPRNCRAFGLGLSIGFVNRTKPASYAVHDDADAFHANKYGERNVQKVGPVVQGFGNVG